MTRIKIKNIKIEYKIRKSKRARRLRIAVYCDTSIVVTMPSDFSENKVKRFISDKANWIISKLFFFKRLENSPMADNSKKNYLKLKNTAFEFANKRVEHYNNIYNFRFNKINIKNLRTKWGSCSIKRNLNFNYKIVLMPEKIANYIIVHELCHLKEFNHSVKFWNLVAKLMPDYLEIKEELKNKGLNFYYGKFLAETEKTNYRFGADGRDNGSAVSADMQGLWRGCGIFGNGQHQRDFLQ